MTLGQELRAAREAKGLTQLELSRMTKVHNISISRYENDLQIPNEETLNKLKNVLSINHEQDTIDKVNKFKEEKGISNRQLANMIGVNSRTIDKLIKGRKASKETLQKIITILNDQSNPLIQKITCALKFSGASDLGNIEEMSVKNLIELMKIYNIDMKLIVTRTKEF